MFNKLNAICKTASLRSSMKSTVKKSNGISGEGAILVAGKELIKLVIKSNLFPV